MSLRRMSGSPSRPSADEPSLRSVEGMDDPRLREASTTTDEDRHADDRGSLLGVLPFTTAVGGAVSMFLVPGTPVVVGSLLTRDAGSLAFLVMGFPLMATGAAGVFLLGLAVGALAGFPDHLARDRPALRPLTSALAVVILTALICTAWVAALWAWWPHARDMMGWSTGVVAGAAAVATTLVVMLHRRGRRGAR
jgi:hypothetical protein